MINEGKGNKFNRILSIVDVPIIFYPGPTLFLVYFMNLLKQSTFSFSLDRIIWIVLDA